MKRARGPVLFSLLFVAACVQPEGGGGTPSASLLDAVQERGVLRVGAECVYKGTCFLDPDTGERVGYSVELTRILARDLGVEVEWLDMEWSALIPAIGTGQIDVITQGMTNSPERAKVVEMTKAMDYYPGALVLPPTSPLHGVTDLNAVWAALDSEDKTITFLLGGTQELMTKALLPKAKHRGLDVAAAYMEIASGRADAMLVDAGDAWDMIHATPGGKIWQDRVVYTLTGSMVIRPGDQRFLNWLNTWIDYYSGNQTLRTIKLKWYEARGVPSWMRVLPPGAPGAP